MFKYLKSGFYTTSLALSLGLATTAVVTPTTAYAESQMMKVYTKFTNDELVRIIKKQYPNTEILKSGLIRVESEQIRIMVDNRYNDDSLRIFVRFDDNNGTWSLKDVNNWNKDMRFIQSSISGGNLDFEIDIKTEYGVTEEHILHFVEAMSFIRPLMQGVKKD